ncbi:uncharacterized protein EI90DRAFT_109209 [Cantharellus anzutake]|uniref:uncharacterized protein n=1 Tax=Cantharellus anzutake TaxID=1750568 RepID=UPI00190887C2|nr:uncharacterized protein EI90DRAFT_109209 [Cantharellus anzutake]KAF8337076.1 hypothetical protein EI90DRAFT_109209 [Cantharellus anzutake]
MALGPWTQGLSWMIFLLQETCSVQSLSVDASNTLSALIKRIVTMLRCREFSCAAAIILHTVEQGLRERTPGHTLGRHHICGSLALSVTGRVHVASLISQVLVTDRSVLNVLSCNRR